MKRLIVLFLFTVAFAGRTFAQENITPEQEAFFEKHIRPALVNYCYECHSLKGGKTLGGLLLDTRESIRGGGDSGPAVQPGSLDDSVLWEAINWEGYEMPPKEQMPKEIIAHFKQWIEMGAPDPRERETFFVESEMDIEAGKNHWAFQQPRSSSGGNIDRFVDAKLKSAGIKPAPAADAFTLLRRLNFDLIGLPPTATEARKFYMAYNRNAPAAVEAKVDELLGRPQFGERWGRHWLDVARYAESSGKTNFSYPHAWRYRDFVIDAFNKGTPYDHFIKQQIAGDLLPAKTDEIWQENLLATGFLAVGLKDQSERNPREFRMNLVDEQIDTMSRAFIGLTVSCARCHDHKYDPIPTLDYYSLAGIFQSTTTYYGTVFGQQNHRHSTLLILPLEDKNNAGEDYSPAEIEGMKDEIAKTRNFLRTRRGDSNSGGKEIVQREMVAARNKIGRLEGILATLGTDGQAKTYGMGVQDVEEPANGNVLKGGDVEKPGQEVERGFLQVMDGFGPNEIPADQSGRKQLAQWLSSKDNPLTARVMVNRVWLHLFGEGLVRSPNNWGLQGETPTHPELLDHLAVDFMQNGWSIKKLIKQIVMTHAYGRSSQYNAVSFKADSENKLLWRMAPQQLDAEAMRDSMLAISGQLQYERPYASEIAKIGDIRFGRMVDADDVGQNHLHRAVYMPIVRDQVHESLKVFDFADANIPVARRDATNVPSQSLYLMNSPFVITAASKMAEGLIKSHKTTNERVKWAFIQSYGRMPTADEIAASVEFFQRFSADGSLHTPVQSQNNGRTNAGTRPGGRPNAGDRLGPGGRRRQNTEPVLARPSTPEHQSLTLFCQSLMASAEFRILN